MPTTAAPATPIRPLPRGCVLRVAGVSRHQDVVRTLRIGDPVVLRHDPSNPYDVHAVAVLTTAGQELGRVARDLDLHLRLAVPTPGGVWAARVSDILGTDTVGLRVQLGDLVSQGAVAAFGADLPGLRHRSDGYVDPTAYAWDSTALLAATDTDTACAVPARPVRSRSGRVLGWLCSADDQRVRVTPAALGAPCPLAAPHPHLAYPASTVIVDDQSTAPTGQEAAGPVS